MNDTAVIRQNPMVTAINSALEIDLTGQVAADSLGTRQYSGVGGQMISSAGRRSHPAGSRSSCCHREALERAVQEWFGRLPSA